MLPFCNNTQSAVAPSLWLDIEYQLVEYHLLNKL